MVESDQGKKQFLEVIWQATSGETGVQVSMYEIGDTLGLDRTQSSAIAEELIVDGYAELVTLSGGVAITAEGLLFCGKAQQTGETQLHQRLSGDTILSGGDVELINSTIAAVRGMGDLHSLEFEMLETLMMDVKTLEVQLLSPSPKFGIVSAIIAAIAETISKTSNQVVSDRLQGLIG